ncbi:hypothetical protein [Streptomyces canus]|uniref:Uncharacterized protein n=1 Tax=Streptomyces canus TaxID=58343 RepID=A0AAW8FDQ1_9ACTN|nr:hypothetical protein [Streptomyces canus]MDQ0763337.1 hypothetical protein [Streptomyces canus]MDQ0908209.1 hypothetical protein [Streptomyces canus]
MVVFSPESPPYAAGDGLVVVSPHGTVRPFTVFPDHGLVDSGP